MAGFRIGRGRDSRPAQQQGQYPPQQAPGTAPGQYGQRGAPQQPPYGTQGAPTGRGGQVSGRGSGPPRASWPHMNGGPAAGGGHRTQGGHGEPEYFGDPHSAPTHGSGQRGGPPPGAPSDAPGHTTAFRVPDPYGPDDGEYTTGSTYGGGNSPVPTGPRLGWKDLLRGIVLRPNATFLQMRDYPVWGPAILITFLYGLLAIFGLDEPREEVINATLGSAIPYVLTTGVAVVAVGLILGAVTHTLARQFGGTGAWQPTIGLSMLIMALTDAPRLLFALFLGGTAPLVQVLGWATWVVAGLLFTSMVSRSHELPWPKALGASAIQLLALLSLIKLGTL